MSVVEDERFEQLIAFLGSQLPAPVESQTASDGSMVFMGGAPAEVVVHLTASSVTVSEYVGTWESPDRFTLTPRRLGLLKWRRLSETVMMQALSALIKGAREMRLAHYRRCTICDDLHPPEVLTTDNVCPSCAETPPSTVH